MEFCFYLNFNESHGLGHLTRCSNFALHLRANGHIVTLLTSTLRVDQHHYSDNFLGAFTSIHRFSSLAPNIRLDNSPLVQEIIDYVARLPGHSKVIIDYYDFIFSNITMFGGYNIRVFLLQDDFPGITKDLAVADKNFYQVYFLPPESLTLSRKDIAGIDLIPLFPPGKLHLKCPEEYSNGGPTRRILLAPGAAGIDQIRAFLKSNRLQLSDPTIALFTYEERLCIPTSPKIHLIDGSSGILPYIAHSTCVITAAGNTMIESIFLGKLTIAFSAHLNHDLMIKHYRDQNKVWCLSEFRHCLKLLKTQPFSQAQNSSAEISFAYDKLINYVESC